MSKKTETILICEDKNLMDDGVGEENALNINMEEMKTDSEMEVETNDQESPGDGFDHRFVSSRREQYTNLT